jgi:hypothetical protein
LNDIKGTTDYQYNWQGWQGRNATFIIDLGKTDSISTVQLNFLENSSAWIVGPKSFQVRIGQTETEVLSEQASLKGILINPNAGNQMIPGIYTLKLSLDQKIAGRYLLVEVNNIGPLPKWRGVDGDAWLFIDEIEIH